MIINDSPGVVYVPESALGGHWGGGGGIISGGGEWAGVSRVGSRPKEKHDTTLRNISDIHNKLSLCNSFNKHEFCPTSEC